MRDKIFRNMVLFFPENALWKLFATLNHWTPNKLAREHVLFTDTLSQKVFIVLLKQFPSLSSLIEELTIVSVISEI